MKFIKHNYHFNILPTNKKDSEKSESFLLGFVVSRCAALPDRRSGCRRRHR